MGTGGCHTQPSFFSAAPGRPLWESLSTHFCHLDRKILKTPGCWIIPFYMRAGQQPNRMAYRDLSKGTVARKAWNPYYTDTALYPVLCLPTPLPHTLQRGGWCSDIYGELWWFLKHLAASKRQVCWLWFPRAWGDGSLWARPGRNRDNLEKISWVCFPYEKLQIKDVQ